MLSYWFIYFMNRLKKTTQNALIITGLWLEIGYEGLTNTKHKCRLQETFFLFSEIDFKVYFNKQYALFSNNLFQ
jgi:hypothetical protein